MTDLLLDECGDLDVTNGRLSIVSGADAVRQRWLIYIRTFLGEWFLDQDIGVPYFQTLFRKQISRQTIKQVFTQASLEVPGILQVVSVVIDQLDVAARFAEVTVTCVIDGDEGPETGQFKYTGTIPPEGCEPDSEVPNAIPGLLAWFDVSRPRYYSQIVGSSLSIQNRAGAGALQASSTGPVPHVWQTSPLHGKPAVYLPTPANNDVLNIVGIPALRDTTGYDGSFTIFCVSKLVNAGQVAGSLVPIWALDGVEATGVTREWYLGQRVISTPAFGAGGNGGARLTSQRLGFAAVHYGADVASGLLTPAVVDDAHDVRAWRRDFSISPAPRSVWVNGYPFEESANDGTPALRLLNGSGVIGAAYDTAGLVVGYNAQWFGEWLMYGRALTVAEFNAVQGYLLAKWGVPKSV